MSLNLTCRCGWSKAFDDTQIGIAIQCPECDRDFLITDDCAEFLNRNVGGLEFSFADDVEAPETAPAAGRAPRTGSPAGSSVSYRPAGRSRTLRSMRRATGDKKSSAIPVLIAVLIVVGVVGGALLFLQSRDREAALRDGERFVDQVMDLVSQGRLTLALGYFRPGFDATELQDALVTSREQTGESTFERSRLAFTEVGTPDSFTAYYRAVGRRKGYECRLEVERVGGAWRVTTCRVREMNPAEITGE